MRITIEVTNEEHAKLKAAAGLIKLGPWVRHVALTEASGERLGMMKQVEKAEEVVLAELERATVKPGMGWSKISETAVDSKRRVPARPGKKSDPVPVPTATVVSSDACSHGYTTNDCPKWICWRYKESNGRGVR